MKAHLDERTGMYSAELDYGIDDHVSSLLEDLLVETGAEYGVTIEIDSASRQAVYDLKAEFYVALESLGLIVAARD